MCAVTGCFLVSAGCASLPRGADYPKQASSAIAPMDGKLSRAIVSPKGAAPDTSGFRMLSAGVDGLAVRLEMIGSAERSLDLQYYIFRNDESGSLIAQALLAAADRGVRVRLLVDDGETVAGDENVFALAAHPLIQIRIYNPFDYRGHSTLGRGVDFLLHKKRLDHRMHDKLMVVDNALALIGGRNIGDQYFQIDPDSQFGDDDVAVAGPMVRQLSGVFDQFWNSDSSIPAAALDRAHTSDGALTKYRTALDARRQHSAFQADLLRRVTTGEPFAAIMSGRTPLVWAHARLVYDSPDKASTTAGSEGKMTSAAVAEQTSEATTEVLMVTPYFVPTPKEFALIARERERNVRVSILTNSLESAPDLAAQSGYIHYRKAMLADGVELHEIRALLGSTRGSGEGKAIASRGNYALHAKLYVFDRKSVFVGSFNFDQRSKRLNTEIGLIISSPELAAQTAARFDSLTQPGNSYSLALQDAGDGKGPRVVWKTEVGGEAVEYTHEPARNEWQKVQMRLLSLLPLDKEL